MKKNSALIINEKENCSNTERIRFYFFKMKNIAVSEIVSISNVDFILLNVPKVKNKRQKLYLAQYIEKQFHYNNVIYNGNSLKCKKNENYISYAIQYNPISFIKKYAKLNQVKFKQGTVILICDNPAQAENFIKKICKDIYQIELYCSNISQFEETVQYFSDNYGIFLKTMDKIGGREKNDTLVISISKDEKLLRHYLSEKYLPVLNASELRFGFSNVYEDAVFVGNKEINQLAKKYKIFNSEFLKFLAESFGCIKERKKWMEFIKKYEIKCIKLLKNN